MPSNSLGFWVYPIFFSGLKVGQNYFMARA